MEQKFIPLEKIATLEEGFAWLSDYETVKDEKHKVARNEFERDIENTKLLVEIGQLNKKRKQLIAKLLTNSKDAQEKLKSFVILETSSIGNVYFHAESLIFSHDLETATRYTEQDAKRKHGKMLEKRIAMYQKTGGNYKELYIKKID